MSAARPSVSAWLAGARWRIAAAVLSGCCMWLASPGFDLWWLSLFGWCPLFWACHRQSLRTSFLLSWITGIVAVVGGYTWLSMVMEFFAGFPWWLSKVGLLVFAMYQGLQWGLPGLAMAYLQRRFDKPGEARGFPHLVWIAALSWCGVEWALPQLFRVHIGYFWARQAQLIQHAEFGGTLLVSATMLAVNAALFEVLRRRYLVPGGRWSRSSAILLVGLWLAIPGYGRLRMAMLEPVYAAAPTKKIAVVQGNFGIRTRRNRNLRPTMLRNMQQQTAALESEGAELVLWGETSYPYGRWPRKSQGDFPVGDRRRIRQGFKVPIIVGTAMYERAAAGRKFPRIYNTALALDASGRDIGRYDKHKALLFGEWVPLVDPDWFRSTFPSSTMIERGPGPGVLEVEGHRYGALICYEDLLPEFVIGTAELGVEALLNFTNDSWFADSRAARHHLALSVLRTVEQRRSLVRAVNAGISAYIDPLGRLHHETPLTNADRDGYRGTDGFVAEVVLQPADLRTPFARFGRWWGPFSALALIAFLILARRRS